MTKHLANLLIDYTLLSIYMNMRFDGTDAISNVRDLSLSVFGRFNNLHTYKIAPLPLIVKELPPKYGGFSVLRWRLAIGDWQ